MEPSPCKGGWRGGGVLPVLDTDAVNADAEELEELAQAWLWLRRCGELLTELLTERVMDSESRSIRVAQLRFKLLITRISFSMRSLISDAALYVACGVARVGGVPCGGGVRGARRLVLWCARKNAGDCTGVAHRCACEGVLVIGVLEPPMWEAAKVEWSVRGCCSLRYSWRGVKGDVAAPSCRSSHCPAGRG